MTRNPQSIQSVSGKALTPRQCRTCGKLFWAIRGPAVLPHCITCLGNMGLKYANIKPAAKPKPQPVQLGLGL